MKKTIIAILCGSLLMLACTKENKPRNSFPIENENIHVTEHANMQADLIADAHFFNASEGIVLAMDKIYKTKDAGKTWNVQYEQLGLDIRMSHLLFMDNRTGYATGNILTSNGTSPKTFLLITKDAGESWTVVYQTEDGQSFDALSKNNEGYIFILAAQNSNSSSTTRSILKSTNEGKTWTTVFSSKNIYLTEIVFNNDLGFCAGVQAKNGTVGNGIILKSNDNGNSWNVSSTFSENMIRQIVFKEGTGYCNAYTAVYKTTNNGSNWDVFYKDSGSGTVSNIECISANNCIITGSGRFTDWGCFGYSGSALRHTKDGGQTWTSFDLEYAQIIQPFSFYSSTEGYAFESRKMLKVSLK